MTEVEKYVDAEAYLEALKSGEITFDEPGLFDEFLGSDELIKDDVLDLLVGVPFAVLAVTFRGGFTREVHGVKVQGDYASLKIITGDEKSYTRQGVDREKVPFEPLSILRFNDGSTGVRRQVVAYLVAKGAVTLREGIPAEELEVGGKLGESDYDIPVGMWHDVPEGEMRFTPDGGTVFDYTFERPLIVRRGLRLSEYENENGKNVTRYFA